MSSYFRHVYFLPAVSAAYNNITLLLCYFELFTVKLINLTLTLIELSQMIK